MTQRHMHLIGYLMAGPTGHHNGSWRHPDSDVDLVLDPERYENLARILERGLFDGVFFVDFLTLHDLTADSPSLVARRGGQMAMLQPLQLLAAMARVTSRIGLTATMTTAFHAPYHLAREFATLDHISKGRAGWNVVTSVSDLEARNYGLDQLMEKEQRYDHADEVLEACIRLWDSWEADALLVDREHGLFADPAKIHPVDYHGAMVHTQGAFTTPRPPQGRPVLMQAGSSPRGRAFAARWAEVIFTLQHEQAEMRSFYADMKARVVAQGRSPRDCAILPAIDVIIGETEAIARERADRLDSLATYELSIRTISTTFGRDLSDLPLDTPLETIEMGPRAMQGAYDNMKSIIRKEGLTLGDAARHHSTTAMTPRLIGTPAMIADRMQDMFETGCCDGFVVSPSLSPISHGEFVDLVVPELQRRGIYRTGYAGTTFRDHLRQQP